MDLVSVEAYTADEVSMNDAPVTVASDGSSGGGSKGSGSVLPKTADPGVSTLAGGAALAGAALVAYGRRRAEVEREAAGREPVEGSDAGRAEREGE